MHLHLDATGEQNQVKVNLYQMREGLRKMMVLRKDHKMLPLYYQVVAPSISNLGYFQSNSLTHVI